MACFEEGGCAARQVVLVVISDGRANVPLAVSEGEELLTAEAQVRARRVVGGINII